MSNIDDAITAISQIKDKTTNITKLSSLPQQPKQTCDKILLINRGLTGGFGGVFSALAIYSALHFNGIGVMNALPLVVYALFLDAFMIAGIDYIDIQH